MPPIDDTGAAIDRVFREVSGQAVATLVRVFGDISVAEDAVQDAFVVASVKWHDEGIPPNPAGWIVTTAKRRAIDHVRRTARGRELVESAAAGMSGDDSEPFVDAIFDGPVDDDRLRLIFTCCHPALRAEHQVALTLRLLGGLSVGDIAHAFVVGESTMAKRLVRAKFKIKAANIPYQIPNESDLRVRLRSVLAVLYLIYNGGTADISGGAPLRREAIRLTRALVDLLSDEPECRGLLALMLLNESRMESRIANDEIVLLRDQDRTLWNRPMIAEGHAIVRRCVRDDRPGPFQLQAAIQAVHCSAVAFDDTDWLQIVELYNHLFALAPTPIVALNRAIAISEVDGPAAGLAIIDAIGSGLESYGPLHTSRAALLRHLGRRREAVEAYERGLVLTASDGERRHIARQLAVLLSP